MHTFTVIIVNQGNKKTRLKNYIKYIKKDKTRIKLMTIKQVKTYNNNNSLKIVKH